MKRERDTVGKRPHLLIHSQNAYNNIDPKLGSRNSIQFSHVGSRNPITSAITVPHRVCIFRNLESGSGKGINPIACKSLKC